MWWADRIREWDTAGKDAFVYFNKDGNANAVRNAHTLRTLLDQLPRHRRDLRHPLRQA
jgi:uncharacterized protein YecE (DUF72 family)